MIDFAAGKNRNLTFVTGAAGTGKTNIINALKWVLTGFSNVTTDASGTHILNYDAIKEAEMGSTIKCWALLTFQLEELQYKIKRSHIAIKMEDDIKTKLVQVEISKFKAGDKFQKGGVQLTIDNMFSQEVFKHLIYEYKDFDDFALDVDAELLSLIKKLAKDDEIYLFGILEHIGNKSNDPELASYYTNMLGSILTEIKMANKDTDISNADKVIVSVLLKAVLVNCLKDSNSRSSDSDYPLIIDLPFNYLDLAKAEFLLFLISKLADQVVIVCSKSDCELINKVDVGKSYLLEHSKGAFKSKIVRL